MKTQDMMRSYQNRCVRFIKNRMNCALWVDMGLGKTVSTLTALSELMAEFEVQKTLVVAPLRVARKVWSDEVNEWAHLKHLRVSVICGTAAERIKAMEADADIYTVNRENFRWLCQFFIIQKDRRIKQIKHWPWDTVVIDEADSFKSQSSERWKWMNRARRMFPRMIQLTGTPTSNGYLDAWAQIKLLDGGKRLFNSEEAFRNRWMDPPSHDGGQWAMKDGSDRSIANELKDIVVALQADDYLDLPPLITNFIRVELPPKVLAKYQEMERKFILEIVPDKKITAVNGGVLYGKLLQLASGSVYRAIDETTKEVISLHNEKMPALLETLEGLRGPILIGFNFKHEASRLEAALSVWSKTHNKTCRFMKSTQDENDWNAGKIDIMMLHPASGGHGLNLHLSGSENLIWFGPTPSRALFDQLNGRIAGGHRRTGRNVVIHIIIASETIDELDVLPRLDQRGDAQNRILKLLRERVERTI